MGSGTRVAVLTDEAGRVTDARAAATARVYRREGGVWLPGPEIRVPHSGDGMGNVRDDMRELIGALDGCRVLAARGLGGVAYGVFDRMGFHIFDVSEVDDPTLNGMLRDIGEAEEAERVKREMLKSARPVPTGDPGVYFLDLILLQARCPEVSSKRALRDFLSGTPFVALHLICSHAPPWLGEAGLDITTARRPDGSLHLTITPRACGAKNGREAR